jgi:hypothetical protein
MGYTLRQVEAESKFCQSLTVEALERAVPLDTIKAVLQQQGVQVQRERKLNPTTTPLFDIRVTTRYVAPAYPREQQETAYVTSLSDPG